MKSECPMGHTENLSHDEVKRRLLDGDFKCKEETCSKNVTYEVDERLWQMVKYRVMYR